MLHHSSRHGSNCDSTRTLPLLEGYRVAVCPQPSSGSHHLVVPRKTSSPRLRRCACLFPASSSGATLASALHPNLQQVSAGIELTFPRYHGDLHGTGLYKKVTWPSAATKFVDQWLMQRTNRSMTSSSASPLLGPHESAEMRAGCSASWR